MYIDVHTQCSYSRWKMMHWQTYYLITRRFIDLFRNVSMNEGFNVHLREEGMKNKLLKLINSDT